MSWRESGQFGALGKYVQHTLPWLPLHKLPHFLLTQMSERTMHFLTPMLRQASTMAPCFIPSWLYNIEEIEDYQPGGYHPISIGNTFDQGRYRILHKLGLGGSSTVWLVCDQQEGKG